MALQMLLVAAFLFLPSPWKAAGSAPEVEVKVKQKYLVAVCLNGGPVHEGERRWRLAPGSHLLTFTMRNAAGHGVPDADVDPGIAVVRVMLEGGHEYEHGGNT